MILIDSNILIDVLDRDPVWYDWSVANVSDASKTGRMAINHIVVAEVAPFAGKLNDFLTIIDNMGLIIEPLCSQSAYCAGLAFRKYRRQRNRASTKTILPDFLIGGHALAISATIMTRDPRFYRTYFPSVPLITPSKDQND